MEKKRYFSRQDFVTFINILEENKPTKLYTECLEDGEEESYTFLKINFEGSDIVLYSNPYASVGMIQDTPVAPMEDYAESVYEDFEHEGEYKIFIKEE